MKRLITTSLALLLLAQFGQANAAFLTYSETFTASGTLNGVTFTSAAIEVDGTANTANIVNVGGIYGEYMVPVSTTITINGSTTSITDQIILLDYSTYPSPSAAVVFGDATNSSQLVGLFSSALNGYNLATPIFAAGTTNNTNPGVTFGTSSGALVFSSFSAVGAFTATVPEPSSMAMTGLGLALAATWVRTRRARRQTIEA